MRITRTTVITIETKKVAVSATVSGDQHAPGGSEDLGMEVDLNLKKADFNNLAPDLTSEGGRIRRLVGELRHKAIELIRWK